ncbi:Kelch protein 10 [Fasciola gigantica]|uniref:Kelch protein 10 n=2 Tax=Fasciola TaxID=6191 RepID=A0A2H1C7J9_FASHE|nr:Kelch protein 10 [Fasciola hepatica]TPP65430.1 Kelch protein 10 [Fasciola gigantica]
MSHCSFINTLPEYVLDRTVIINDAHEHHVSGYKLAKASDYFKRQLVELRQGELEKSLRKEDTDESRRQNRRARARSLCDLELQPLVLKYPDLYGLESVLSFIHCCDKTRATTLSSRLNTSTAGPMLKAGLHFQVPSFISHCLDVIQSTMNDLTCWRFWKLAEELAAQLPEFQQITTRYVLVHFLEAGETEEFLELTVEELKKLLREDALNCANEKLLFALIEKWVYHKQDKRKVHIAELLECLRLGRLTHEDLDRLSANPLIQTAWVSCSSVILMSRFSVEELASNPSGTLTPRSGDETELHAYLRRPRLPHSAIFVVGGWEGNQDDPNFGPSKAIQVYNSRADTWRRVVTDGVALDEGHAYSGCVLYKTRIYVVGGYVSSGPTQTLKVFELTNLTWKFLSPMHEKRNYVCTCMLDNVIYAIGGHNGRHRLSSVERYDVDQNHWAFVSPMRQVRSDAGADALLGRIYVVGGFDGHHFYDSVEVYDPRTDQWSLVAPMHNIRSGVSVIVYDHYLFAIGGNDGLQRLRTVERYDPETNQWQTMPSMIRQRSNFCIAILEGMIYVMGGWSDETNSTIALVERWTPNLSSQWEPVRELFLPASANCCCSVSGLDLVSEFLYP